MPLSSFSGNRNWGYDGAMHFSPPSCYGIPDDLRDFVDQAHSEGIAVILDVVFKYLNSF